MRIKKDEFIEYYVGMVRAYLSESLPDIEEEEILIGKVRNLTSDVNHHILKAIHKEPIR